MVTRPKTGGRKKGTPNKSNRERIAAAEASGMMPHEFLLAVSRGQDFDGYKPSFAERMKAATEVANYYAPKLSTIEHGNGENGPLQIVITSGDAEL